MLSCLGTVLQCGTRHLRCGSDVTDREEGRNHCRPGDQEAAEGEPVSRERDSPEGEWVSRDRDSPEAEGVGRERRRCSSLSEGESHGRGKRPMSLSSAQRCCSANSSTRESSGCRPVAGGRILSCLGTALQRTTRHLRCRSDVGDIRGWELISTPNAKLPRHRTALQRTAPALRIRREKDGKA